MRYICPLYMLVVLIGFVVQGSERHIYTGTYQNITDTEQSFKIVFVDVNIWVHANHANISTFNSN